MERDQGDGAAVSAVGKAVVVDGAEMSPGDGPGADAGEGPGVGSKVNTSRVNRILPASIPADFSVRRDDIRTIRLVCGCHVCKTVDKLI